jgi:hypothetical protein
MGKEEAPSPRAVFQWSGKLFASEAPRTVRLPANSALALVLLVLVLGGWCALGLFLLDRGNFDLVLVCACTFVILAAVVMHSFQTLRRERRLLQAGTIAFAVVGADKSHGTFRDAEGREHMVSVAPVPPEIESGMSVPVFYDPAEPGRSVAMTRAFLEIEFRA